MIPLLCRGEKAVAMWFHCVERQLPCGFIVVWSRRRGRHYALVLLRDRRDRLVSFDSDGEDRPNNTGSICCIPRSLLGVLAHCS